MPALPFRMTLQQNPTRWYRCELVLSLCIRVSIPRSRASRSSSAGASPPRAAPSRGPLPTGSCPQRINIGHRPGSRTGAFAEVPEVQCHQHHCQDEHQASQAAKRSRIHQAFGGRRPQVYSKPCRAERRRQVGRAPADVRCRTCSTWRTGQIPIHCCTEDFVRTLNILHAQRTYPHL